MSDEIDQIPTIPAKASTIAPGTPDRNGVPFDPARHIAKQHPRSGAWMPKGGRKPKTASGSSPSISSPPVRTEPATSENSSPSPVGSPGESVKIDALIEISDAPAPPPKAPTADTTRPAATPPPVDPAPDVGPSAPPPDASAPGAAPAGPELSPEHAGELGARALYTVTGCLLKDHKAAVANGAEHANIRAVATAYARSRGVRIVGTAAVVLTVVGYLLDEKRMEKVLAFVRGFFQRDQTGDVVDIIATPSTPIPAASPTPAQSAPVNPFIGGPRK